MEGVCTKCKSGNVPLSWLILKSEEKETKLWLCNVCFTNARNLWNNFIKENGSGELTDEDLMYFGKYKDTKLEKVPASYLLWCGDQDWIKKHTRLQRYIEKNRSSLEEEAQLGK